MVHPVTRTPYISSSYRVGSFSMHRYVDRYYTILYTKCNTRRFGHKKLKIYNATVDHVYVCEN